MATFQADNAIILAAGYSSRLVPLCFDLPKGLLPINGETLIERQIKQLREINIDNIYIVTGAHAEKFEFLKQKYQLELIFNKDYLTKNNFASIYAAKDVLANSVISSSDLYFPRNIFQKETEVSYYLSVFVKHKTNQRTLQLDKNNRIIKTAYGGENCWITFGGQAFFTNDLSKKLINYIKPVYNDPQYADKYWVDFQDQHLEDLPMYIKKIQQTDIVEFNTLEDLRTFDKTFSAIHISPTMKFLCNELNSKENELSGFKPVLCGKYAIGCIFNYKNKQFRYTHNTKCIEELKQ